MNNRNFFSAAIEKAMLGDPMKYFKKIGETVENRYAEVATFSFLLILLIF
jgi:hypothetical protein